MRPAESLEAVALSIAATLVHRGPDDVGVWADAGSGITLGHRRLAILDLSPAGHQHMFSVCGRYVMAFNGEIYNHLELRKELWGLGLPRFSLNDRTVTGGWRGNSDSETLLAGIAAWGLEATLKRCVGMFAIALWDRQTQSLSLARDRLGKKPLYYGWVSDVENRTFVFASELKALRAYPEFGNPVCRQVLAQHMRFMYVPAPRSIYQGIYKLEPGCILIVARSRSAHSPSNPLRPGQEHGSLRIDRWWALSDVVAQGACNTDPEEVLLPQLERTLAQAMQGQSLADMPLGAFLSGGVDSSTIVALMQKQARASGSAPGHKAPRNACHGANGARRDPRIAVDVRRTFCRFVANPHPPGVQGRPAARHSGLEWRCWR